MNTVEHIVDCYFRICRKCFTMNDVKVDGGNNRQFDLLAVSLLTCEQFHVESSVSHSWDLCPDADTLLQEFDRKFFGVPPKRDGKNTDFTKGKNYRDQINAMYCTLGLNADKINRVYCTWIRPTGDGLNERIIEYSQLKKVRPIEVISFRDEILPRLQESVATANYEDEALRTLSLLRQREIQLKPQVTI